MLGVPNRYMMVDCCSNVQYGSDFDGLQAPLSLVDISMTRYKSVLSRCGVNPYGSRDACGVWQETKPPSGTWMVYMHPVDTTRKFRPQLKLE
jgi:hypothetical protein